MDEHPFCFSVWGKVKILLLSKIQFMLLFVDEYAFYFSVCGKVRILLLSETAIEVQERLNL